MKKNKIVVAISLMVASLITYSQASSNSLNPRNESTDSSSQAHAVTGKLGWIYPNVAQALTQHVISWDQHLKLGEYIKALGNREAAVDKALAENIIDAKQAEIIKFMFNDAPQLDLATANKIGPFIPQ